VPASLLLKVVHPQHQDSRHAPSIFLCTSFHNPTNNMSRTINWEEAMNQVGGDRDFLEEVLQDLMNEAETARAEIAQGIKDNDFSLISKAAHRIKGSASYLCCEDVRKVSLDMQELGHEGMQPGANHREIMHKIESAFQDYERFIQELKDAVAKRGK
jgi:HPt (histidine-containing phosphotransfer) domain-containing protein